MNTFFETKNLEVYRTHQKICTNLNWQIAPHEIWGILGQNGCGKTTLLLTLAGLLPPQSGEIFLFQKEINQIKRKDIAKNLAILFQDNKENLLPQTVYEYCRSGRYPHLTYFSTESAKDRDIINQALTAMDLEHLLHKSVHTLSGGEYQRLRVATILTQAPVLYLLDEPINHLDLRYQFKVLNYFHQLVKTTRTAVVMTLHDLRMAQKYCDKIILFLKHGEFLLGTPKEILTLHHIQSAYDCCVDKEFLQI